MQQWKIERNYQRRCERKFKTECRAYHRLLALQGICIPEFYGTTSFFRSHETSESIHFGVYGVLIQFIEGIEFDEISAQSSYFLTHPHPGEVAVDCFEKMISMGVLHDDVRLANIILAQDDRVFVIDFALAILREENETNEEWNEQVDVDQEVGLIKLFLDQRQLRDRTPLEPCSDEENGFTSFNGFVRGGREGWQRKYYEQISDSEQVEYRICQHGDEYRYEHSNWRLILKLIVFQPHGSSLATFKDTNWNSDVLRVA